MKNDQNSADLLASAFENILASDEHKEMFKKEAQWVGDKGTLPGSQRSDNGMTITDDPNNSGSGALKSTKDQLKLVDPKKPFLTGDIISQLEKIKVNTALAGIYGDEVANLAGRILSGTATSAELNKDSPVVQNMYSAINKKTLGSQNSPQGLALALNDINNEKHEEQPPTATASETMLNTLVKIANELGEKGLITSEALADSLIQSIVVEAKQKIKEDKKKAKKEKKEMKKLKKLDKKTKKDMKCEKCNKLCDKCVCEK